MALEDLERRHRSLPEGVGQMKFVDSARVAYIGANLMQQNDFQDVLLASGHEISDSADNIQDAVHLLGKIARGEVKANAVVLQPNVSATRFDGGEALTLRGVARDLQLMQHFIGHGNGKDLPLFREAVTDWTTNSDHIVRIIEERLEEDFSRDVQAYGGLPFEGV